MKTISETYMFVSGVPVPNENHAIEAVECAHEFAQIIHQFSAQKNVNLSCKIGNYNESSDLNIIIAL